MIKIRRNVRERMKREGDGKGNGQSKTEIWGGGGGWEEKKKEHFVSLPEAHL